jgi:alcohol dehydrogenase
MGIVPPTAVRAHNLERLLRTSFLPTSTRQAVFSAPNQISVIDQQIPFTGPGDVLLRVGLVGICATDLHLLAGHIGEPFPLVPGHEFVGEIAALGADAALRRGLKVGDHVAVEMLLPCHNCPRCREGRYNLCEDDDMTTGLRVGRQYGINIPRTVEPGLWGGFSEYLHVPAEAIVHPLPPELPWQRAVLVEPLAVAFRAIARSRLQPGESVVIIGPGPVGLLAAAAARSAGAGKVIVVGTRKSRLDLATHFGADTTINTRDSDTATALREVHNTLADVVIELAGVPSAQEEAVTLVRRGGRVVLAGACGQDAHVTFRADENLLTREVDVLPSFLSAGGFEPAIALLSRGEYPFEELVTHTFGLHEVEQAFGMIRRKEGALVKAVIDPRQPRPQK